MNGADRAAARIERLFGPSPSVDAGAIHVAAIWEESPSSRRFLAIGPGAPSSETDRFVLDFARARADAVLTTGAILRAEPDVTHSIQTPELREYRRDRLGKSAPPVSVVLTTGRELDPSHPVFEGAGGALLLVPDDAALPSACAVPVLRASELDPPRAVALLLERFEVLSLEVGPRVTASLYEADRPLVDELLLSVYLEDGLASRYRGGPFPSRDEVERRLPLTSEPRVETEASGRWRFERYLRR